jgi:hypothetical protein
MPGTHPLAGADAPVGLLVVLALRIVLSLLCLATVELIVPRVAVARLIGGGEARVVPLRLHLPGGTTCSPLTFSPTIFYVTNSLKSTLL